MTAPGASLDGTLPKSPDITGEVMGWLVVSDGARLAQQLSPSNATPGSGIQGAPTSRTRFSLVSELPDFDNLGWIPDGSRVTTGNNVDAGLDIDGVNGIDPDGRAAGLCAGPSPGCRNFTFAYDPPPGGSDPG